MRPSGVRTRPKSTCRNEGRASAPGPRNRSGTTAAAAREASGLSRIWDTSAAPTAASSVISDRGKKHGVSERGNAMGTPVRASSRAIRPRYWSSVQASLNARRQGRGYGPSYSIRKRPSCMICWSSTQMLKCVPTTSMWVDGVPVGAGVRAVGVAEGDVDARELLVLQDVADDVRELDVGADGELPDAIGVLVGVGVLPERVLERLVRAVRLDQAVALHDDGEGRVGEEAELVAQVVAHHAVDHERAVHLAGRGEDLAAGQVAPLVGADEAARLDPPVVGVEIGDEVACRPARSRALFGPW